jgi:phospholipase/carboxylesterase
MPSLIQRRIRDLDCIQYTTDERPELLVVLCHGFGADGDDLVPLGAHFFNVRPKLLNRVQLVFPAALLSLRDLHLPGGRAWWPLDIEKLQRAIEFREFRDLRNEQPAGLPVARAALTEMIEQLQDELQLKWSQVVVGGFSQGAMLATDVALHCEESPAGLMIWSGTLLNEQDWKQRVSGRAGLPVIQSHGREDLILPYEAALWLKGLLEQGGLPVEFISFSGGHSIPQEILIRSAEFLVQRLEALNA